MDIPIKLYGTKDINIIETITIEENQVHVWCIRWREIIEWLKPKLNLLNELEYEKSMLYRREEDQKRYQTGKVLGKILLAQYMNMNASEVEYCIDEKGKPYIDVDKKRMEFNLSHSGDWVLLAFAKNRALGVDVEEKLEMKSYDKIARKMYSELEYQYFQADESKDRFYDIWTAKEAYTKAVGCGLSCDLKSFSVVEHKDKMAVLICGEWVLIPIEIPGCGAHLVVNKKMLS